MHVGAVQSAKREKRALGGGEVEGTLGHPLIRDESGLGAKVQSTFAKGQRRDIPILRYHELKMRS